MTVRWQDWQNRRSVRLSSGRQGMLAGSHADVIRKSDMAVWLTCLPKASSRLVEDPRMLQWTSCRRRMTGQIAVMLTPTLPRVDAMASDEAHEQAARMSLAWRPSSEEAAGPTRAAKLPNRDSAPTRRLWKGTRPKSRVGYDVRTGLMHYNQCGVASALASLSSRFWVRYQRYIDRSRLQ